MITSLNDSNLVQKDGVMKDEAAEISNYPRDNFLFFNIFTSGAWQKNGFQPKCISKQEPLCYHKMYILIFASIFKYLNPTWRAMKSDSQIKKEPTE